MTWIVIAVVLAAAAFAVLLYNGLVQRRNRVRNAWAQIDVQLQRRAELIPDLVESVRAYMGHERAIFSEIMEARRVALGAGPDVAARAAAENALSRQVGSLMALAEAVPELRASTTMQSFQEELASTQNRVGYARQFFNDAVMAYNDALQTFPGNLVAGPLGFRPETFFAADEGSRAHVPVKF